jgi:hypothetical protein
MTNTTELLARGVLIGIGGSALIDVWSLILRRVFHVATLDYAMLGRWIGHFPQGRFFHQRIALADRVRGERPLGWVAHYSIGIAFALVLLGIWGIDWAKSPTVVPALLIGIGSIAAPWFVMQPALGAGIAGSKTQAPLAGRLRNLGTHTVYGVGLYVSALGLSLL